MPKITCQEVVKHIEPKIARFEHGSKPIILKLNVNEIKSLVNQISEDGGQIWAIIGEHNESDTAIIMGINNGHCVRLDNLGGVALERWNAKLTLDELNDNYEGDSHSDKLFDFFKKEAGISGGSKDTIIKV